jgi:tetratricopeptide (TPR) repeat protein
MGRASDILKDLFGGLLNRKSKDELMASFHKQTVEGIYASKWIWQKDEPISLDSPISTLIFGFYPKPSELNELEEACQQSLRLEPNNPELYNNLGFILSKQSKYVEGKFAEAEIAYRKALQLAPDNADLHNNFGAALFEQERYIEAEIEFKEAIWLDPNNCSYRKNLGRTFFLQGKLEEAESEYTSILGFTDHQHTAIGTEEILKEIRAALKK